MLRRIVVETGAVDEIRVGHAEFLRALVHAPHKRLATAGDVFAQRRTRVVRAVHRGRFQQFLRRHRLAFTQPDLRAALGRRFRTGGHFIRQVRFSPVYRFREQQHRHDLRHGRRIAFFMRVLFEQHASGALVDQDRGLRAHRHGQSVGRRAVVGKHRPIVRFRQRETVLEHNGGARLQQTCPAKYSGDQGAKCPLLHTFVLPEVLFFINI